MSNLRAAAVLGGAAVACALLARRWQLRWGATPQELAGPLPGDGLIAKPDLTATRALTVRTPAARVWPWIAQLGQERGGPPERARGPGQATGTGKGRHWAQAPGTNAPARGDRQRRTVVA
jgi:hypothetical protein